ncbi:hypothetical protein AT251_19910 [Enterovibrio nigricans]|nr:hypothetical protein AT251_19910 [Enterovibrio nigricans]
MNGSGDNQNGKYKSANMKESFTLTEATGLYNFLRTIPESIDPTIVDIDELKQTIVQIDSYGGQINEMDTVGNNSNRLCCLIRLEDMAA